MEGINGPGRISARTMVLPMRYLLVWCHLYHGCLSQLTLQDNNAVTPVLSSPARIRKPPVALLSSQGT
jgi:hypothetical protein